MTRPPTQPGERVCDACLPRPHRVYLHFFVRGADTHTQQMWVLNFLEPDLATPVGTIRSYPEEATVRHLATQGQALGTAEAVEQFEAALRHGRGEAWLQLTAEQYRKLRQPSILHRPPLPSRKPFS